MFLFVSFFVNLTLNPRRLLELGLANEGSGLIRDETGAEEGTGEGCRQGKDGVTDRRKE